MANKLRVGIVFGGRSGEHEVSIRSARSVIENIDRTKFETVPIAIAKSGRWLGPAESLKLLPASAGRLVSAPITANNSNSVTLVGDPSRSKGLLSLDNNGRGTEQLDVIFPVLHGTYGEDGTIQGLFEMADIPYVGCGVLASSCGMDKVAMKALFEQAGLPICKHVWFSRFKWEIDPQPILRRISRELGFPCFVKPANMGSSVGVSRATNRKELSAAIDLAARYDRKVIVEEAVDGREIECGVIGNNEPEASLPGEYLIKKEGSEFLDYTEKYSSTGHVEFVVPAPLSKAQTIRIQKMAATAFRAIDGAGLARVDFFLRRGTGELLVNEVNTLPGLTDVSGFPKMWEASGLSFRELINRLIKFALDAHSEKARNITTI